MTTGYRNKEASKEQSTEWRFAIALLKHKMNATAAAREVFKMGSKGGKSPQTASSVGQEYRRKPEVQAYIAEIVCTHLDPTMAIRRVQEIALDTKNPAASLSACKLILEVTGVYQDKGHPPIVPHVTLVNPTPPKKPQAE